MSATDGRGGGPRTVTTWNSGGSCCAIPSCWVWQTFWSDSMREMQREFYAKAKSIRPAVKVGFHLWHNIAFNPMYRAEQDFRPYTEYADFLKPVV